MADEKKEATTKAPAKKVADKPAAEKKAPAKAAASKPAAEKKAPAKAAASKTAAEKPAAEKKAPAKAAASKTADKPAAEKKAPAKAAASKTAAAASADKATTATKPAAAKKKPAEPTEPREHVLKVHHLRPAAGSKKDRTRVGRGEASKGKTAGRGTKGTKARYSVRPGFQGGQLPLHMRTPKLRGFKNPFRVEYQVVNLEKLAELYPKGGDVTIGDLVSKGAVRKNEKVKVLGNGDIAVKLNVAVDKVSGSAEQKIVAAGGSVN
ncbi:50S ribosomal protein L15 [Leifsonia sp. Root112D2]|uniref:50S ribosomal protein L15 n=1 Tax=Leifsonia sp. Root112D2 TaxID=1736426 RepID=UPI0009EA7E6F|nr:50S ribosomal protein L15 [Leifsonia sp. Root112D2]